MDTQTAMGRRGLITGQVWSAHLERMHKTWERKRDGERLEKTGAVSGVYLVTAVIFYRLLWRSTSRSVQRKCLWVIVTRNRAPFHELLSLSRSVSVCGNGKLSIHIPQAYINPVSARAQIFRHSVQGCVPDSWPAMSLWTLKFWGVTKVLETWICFRFEKEMFGF